MLPDTNKSTIVYEAVLNLLGDEGPFFIVRGLAGSENERHTLDVGKRSDALLRRAR